MEEKREREGKAKIRYSDVSVCLFVNKTLAIYVLAWFRDGYFLHLGEPRNAKVLARDTTNNYMLNLASELVAQTQTEKRHHLLCGKRKNNNNRKKLK